MRDLEGNMENNEQIIDCSLSPVPLAAFSVPVKLL